LFDFGEPKRFHLQQLGQHLHLNSNEKSLRNSEEILTMENTISPFVFRTGYGSIGFGSPKIVKGTLVKVIKRKLYWKKWNRKWKWLDLRRNEKIHKREKEGIFWKNTEKYHSLRMIANKHICWCKVNERIFAEIPFHCIAINDEFARKYSFLNQIMRENNEFDKWYCFGMKTFKISNIWLNTTL